MSLTCSLSSMLLLTFPCLAGLASPTTQQFFFGETNLVLITQNHLAPTHPDSVDKNDDRERPNRGSLGHIAKVIITDGALTDDDQPADDGDKKGKKVKKAMRLNTGRIGLTPEQLDESLLVHTHRPTDGSSDHFYFQQRHHGLKILNGRMHVKWDRIKNHLVITNGFYEVRPRGRRKQEHKISPEQAVQQVVLNAGFSNGPIFRIPPDGDSDPQAIFISAPTWADGPVVVVPAFKTDDNQELHLVFEIKARNKNTGLNHHWVVKANDGWILRSETVREYGIHEDFETDGEGWTASGLWHLAETDTNLCLPEPNDSGRLVAYFGDSLTCSYDTNQRVKGSLTSPVFRGLKAGAVLRFKYLLEVEPHAFQVDLNTVTVLVDDREYQLMQLSPNNDNTGSWRQTDDISLAAFAGQDIQLRFTFDSVDDFNNNYYGWLIDDVVVENSNN